MARPGVEFANLREVLLLGDPGAGLQFPKNLQLLTKAVILDGGKGHKVRCGKRPSVC
jgi:hypothetical protein